MKLGYLKLLTITVFLFLNMLAYAGTPPWTFKALTPTTVSVPGNGSAIVQYTVTNESSRTNTLAMKPIAGITQITTGLGVCKSPFTLSSRGSSCTLSLHIDGSKLTTTISDGPVVCQEGSILRCYRPQPKDILNVVLAEFSQTIAFTSAAPSNARVEGNTYKPRALASSALPVSFAIDESSSTVCALNADEVSFINVGTCTINANQAGNAVYASAPQETQSFTVDKGYQTLSFTTNAPSNAIPNGATYTPQATSSAHLPVILSIDANSASVCTITAGVVSFLSEGTCAIKANQVGSDKYETAQIMQNVTVRTHNQSISFTSSAPTNAVVAGNTYTPQASATSGLAVSFSIDSSASSVCSINNGVVSFLSAGTCVINANQGGNGTYNPAPQIAQTLTVGKGSQTLSYTSSAPTHAVVGGSTYTPQATSSAGLTVIFSVAPASTSVCSVTNGIVSFISIGTCTLNANQPGNVNYNPAPQVQQSFLVSQGTQTIAFTSSAPTTATIGGATYTPTASATSGLAVTFTIDASTSSICTVNAGVVTFIGYGNCTINANQAGNANYAAAPQVIQNVMVRDYNQTITFTSSPPSNAVLGVGSYTPQATATSGLSVIFSIDASSASVCSISGGAVTFIGAGTCTINANQPGNHPYNPAPQVQQSFQVGKGSQTISLTSTAPTNAIVGGSTYTPSATASSGLTVIFTVHASSAAVCSISNGDVSFLSVGTCIIKANQPGDTNYNAAPQVQQSFSVGKGPQTISYTTTAPSSAGVGDTYTPAASATSGLTVTLTVDASSVGVCSISSGLISLSSVGTCTINANQAGNGNYYAAPQVQQSFSVSKGNQTIAYTTTAPSNAGVGDTYTPAASATSGLTVTLTVDASSAGVCSIAGGLVSFSSVGTCTINANQAGNSNYNAASQVQQSFSVGKGNQAISYTSNAPSSAGVGDTYTPTANATSGLTVTLTVDASSASVCSISSGLVSFSSVGTCTINADQAGDSNYNAAPQVQQSFSVGKGSQTISYTTSAPSNAYVGGSYTPSATSTSGLTVTLTIDPSSASVCSISGSLVSLSGAGTCTINANQAGDSNYNAAPQVQQSFSVGKGNQTIAYTTSAPSGASAGDTYTPAASATSGLTVTLTVDASSASVCSISSGLVSLSSVGTCTINANQAGDSNYNAAPQVQQSFSVGKGSQTISYTTSAPSNAYVGGSYTPSATSTSGLTVTLTIDPSSASVCSMSSGLVSFLTTGTCTINANQAGDSNYNAASQAQQSFSVGKGPQTISYTSSAPSAAIVGDTYTPTASATSGLTVSLTVDASSASVCSISSGLVSLSGAGTCTINANQAGDSNYNAASQVQQSFSVGKGNQTIAYTTSAPSGAIVGDTYTPTANATSGLTVTLTVDASSASVCSIAGGLVSLSSVGTCTVNANQAGDSNYNAAPQVQQSFSVNKGNQTITYTTTAPSNATIGGSTYTPAATASSGLAVSLSIDASSAGICSMTSGHVSFLGLGVCTINANQAGDSSYNAALQVQQSFSVGKGLQTITFTSNAPTAATVGGNNYTPTATASSGLTVTLSIDASSSSVCSLSGGLVAFNSVGTCTINANQSGNSTYEAAPQAQQSFSITTISVSPAGDGNETISPDTPQSTVYGATQAFTVQANAGYTRSNTVGGTCPAGSWNTNTYTTGTITQSCSVIFSAAKQTYSVTTAGSDGNENISPSGVQTVYYSSTQTFTVTAHTYYTLLNTVGGSCPAGSWNGNVYTTGAIIANCSVNFSATLNTHTISGSVSGLLSGESLVLQNNLGDNLTVSADGSFAFATPVAEGSNYSVTVLTQPLYQFCTVTNASGTQGSSDINNITVTCEMTNTTLTPSLSDLALSIKNTAINPALTGKARTITITNTGSYTAGGINITYPTWPSGTTASSDCGTSLASGASCTITVTPGANATSSCSNNTAPTPDVISVSSLDAPTVNVNVVVLAYGCLYQSGYLFSVDDTTAANTSIAGKLAATQATGAGVIWTSTGVRAVTDYTPMGTGNGTTTPCNGSTDGACNTAVITNHYTPVSTYPLAYYAAGNCKAMNAGGYTDWYLPAICEIGPPGSSGVACPANQQNMTLGRTFPSVNVWSSTEGTGSNTGWAWYQNFSLFKQNLWQKYRIPYVYCARYIT